MGGEVRPCGMRGSSATVGHQRAAPNELGARLGYAEPELRAHMLCPATCYVRSLAQDVAVLIAVIHICSNNELCVTKASTMKLLFLNVFMCASYIYNCGKLDFVVYRDLSAFTNLPPAGSGYNIVAC